jgi:hypothetical protein
VRERIAQRSCSTLEAEKKQFETQVREKQRRHDEIDKKGHTQTAHGSDLEKLQEQSCCFLLWRGEVSADVVASLKGIGEPLALFHPEELRRSSRWDRKAELRRLDRSGAVHQSSGPATSCSL